MNWWIYRKGDELKEELKYKHLLNGGVEIRTDNEIYHLLDDRDYIKLICSSTYEMLDSWDTESVIDEGELSIGEVLGQALEIIENQ